MPPIIFSSRYANFRLLRRMKQRAIISLLQTVSSLQQLQQVHAFLVKTGFLCHAFLLNKLVIHAALPKYGSLEYARSVFRSTLVWNTVICNTMIRSYSQSLFPTESVHLYNQMCQNDVPLDHLTFPFMLKALGRVCTTEGTKNLDLFLAWKGAEVHARIWHSGLNSNVFIGNALIFMYSQLGLLEHARQMFDEMSRRSVVTWNTMIAAYCKYKNFGSADLLLHEMPEKNVASWNIVIARHIRLGDVVGAMKIFEKMPARDAISWNSMIMACTKLEHYERALELFKQMQSQQVEPTESTVVSLLHACAENGALDMGRQLHKCMRQKGLKTEGVMGNALLNMYAKCGNLKFARKVFDEISMKHVSHWNSMIVAHGVHGHYAETLELFSRLENESDGTAKPNGITFLGVMLGCSHRGLIEEGQKFFHMMVLKYGIEPNMKHYGCMVDLLSRGGMLEEAYELIKTIPFRVNSVIWRILLASCGWHGNVVMAELAFRGLCQVEEPVDSDFILLSNVYAGAQRWEDVEKLRIEMIRWATPIKLGISQIEIDQCFSDWPS